MKLWLSDDGSKDGGAWMKLAASALYCTCAALECVCSVHAWCLAMKSHAAACSRIAGSISSNSLFLVARNICTWRYTRNPRTAA
jgi:hypothetical protein